MIKIGIYCNNTQQRKEIRNLLKQYFEDFNIKAQIRNIDTKLKVLQNTMESYAIYNIVLIWDENKITYYKKNYIDYSKKTSNITIGWISVPLGLDKVENIIYNEDYRICPKGVYKLETSKMIRAIPHGDISL